MIQKSFSVSVVGIAYYSVTPDMRKRILEGATLTLRRQPSNPHDPNAIEVYLENKLIGHISRKDAYILSQSIDAGIQIKSAKYSQSAKLTDKSRSFKAYVTTVSPNVALKPLNKIGGFPGIYKIESKIDNKSYVGQAQNIDERIEQHRKDLALGIHKNRDLQKLWNKRTSINFSISVLERAPKEPNAFALQNWLAEREIYWIASEREKGRSLNILDGEFIYTKKAREDEKEYRKFIDRSIKDRKKKIREELRLIEPEFNQKKVTLDKLMKRQRELEELRRKHTGLMIIFYGRGPDKPRIYYDKEINRLEKEIKKARENLRPIEKIKLELTNEMKFYRSHKPVMGIDFND